jgi:hypothetical protein
MMGSSVLLQLSGGQLSASGNIVGSNLSAGQFGSVTGASVSASGTITGGNLATGGTVSATANVTGGNLLAAAGGAISTSGNVTGGNLTVSGNISGNVAGFAVGYRDIPQNIQSFSNYTLVASDAGKHILHPTVDNSARFWTIPANSSVAFPIGTAITFVNQNNAGTLTISILADTLRQAGTGSVGQRSLAGNGIATAIKITSTEWIISGTGLT